MTMQAKAALLFSVLPLAVAHLGYPINTSIPATSSSFGGFYCSGPYPGGYLSDPNSSHPFYFGVDCWTTDGQPAITIGAWVSAVLFTACFIYLVVVIKEEVGYSSFLRDLSAYFFWLAMSWWFGAVLHTAAYLGSQYKNVSDVPEWVYSMGTGSWFLEYLSAHCDSWFKLVLGLRLLFEPCSTCCSTESLWTIMSAFFLFWVLDDLYGHYYYGSCCGVLDTNDMFEFNAEMLIILYGIVRCDFLCVISGVIEVAYYTFLPTSILSWRWFNEASWADITETIGWFLFFIAMLKVLRKNSRKLQTESKTDPLLM